MALFQRKPQTESSSFYYTLGLNRTVALVGLGNPGKDYDGTRHNIGFACLDAFVGSSELDKWIQKRDLKCLLATGNVGDSRVIAIKPATFMNLSGEAVLGVLQFYKIPIENVLVMHDELDIPFGQIRTRMGGSSAGHKGVQSIIQHCGENFGRARIGIGAETALDGADFVLSKFSEKEQAQLPNLIKEMSAIITEYLYGGELPHETRNFIV